MLEEVLPPIPLSLLYLLPQHQSAECVLFIHSFDNDKSGKKNVYCRNPIPYQGYLDRDFLLFNPQLEAQLLYFQSHQECPCYWPELSQEAACISDKAYLLFQDLFRHSALSCLINNYGEQKNLIGNTHWNLNLHGLSIACVCQSFWFSHYYNLYEMLLRYAEESFLSGKIRYEDTLLIQEKLDHLVTTLAIDFEKLYNSCLKQHPSERIKEQQHFLCGLFNNDLEREKSRSFGPIFLETSEMPNVSKGTLIQNSDVDCSFNLGASENNPSVFANTSLSTFYLVQGMFFNDCLLYPQAIECLNKAINYNRYNAQAYLARAYAFFESRKMEEAVADYKKAKECVVVPPLRADCENVSLLFLTEKPKPSFDRIEFSKGFVLGGMQGFNTGAKHFVPSILHSLTGIGQGFWGFIKDPYTVTGDFVDTVASSIEYLIDHLTPEQLEMLAPEVHDALLRWHAIKDFEKGQIIGFAIGKYGVEILGWSGTLKAVRVYRTLKYANASLTLDACAASAKNRKLILEEINKRIAFRKTLFKNGKIKIHWGNQDKHFLKTNNYEANNSYFTISKDKFEKLCVERAGTGESVNGAIMGQGGYRERIDFGEVVGMSITEETGYTPLPTTIGIFHYKENGFFHVVPGRPKQ